MLNDTHLVATLPAWPGATGYGWADLALSDAHGRTAFLYAAFCYEPSWEAYVGTALLLAALLLAACWLVPDFLRRGCESSAHSRAASRECV